MSSSANFDIILCSICSASTSKDKRRQAIFTAECSHTFHFTCITSYVTSGNDTCPVCHAKWNDLPFPKPFIPNPSNSNWNHTHIPVNFSQIPIPPASPFPRYSFPQFPTFEPEPSHFSDDEPLLSTTVDANNSVSSVRLRIKAIPEQPAVAASESVSQFAVLVGLKAPLMANNAADLQRAPLDLVTVLDVSGSMQGVKLNLVKRAVLFVIDNLGASDRLSIVSFSTHARRILRLTRMTEHGHQAAKQAVSSLFASGNTNIVQGLKKGVRVLEERRESNPVSSIIFLSDGNDTCNYGTIFPNLSTERQVPQYLNLLPASIRPQNRTLSGLFSEQQTFPVHSFGFGSDHDPIAMHAISDSSGGTFSFIESFEMVQDAFANCIGGLLSVVIQELRLSVKAASHGVEIKSIPSGRYISEITNHGSDGVIKVGDMYAEEDREFLVNLSVPKLPELEGDGSERKTTLLDITCSYKDIVSKEILQVQPELVEIRRPKNLSPLDMVVNLDVDRQRNRLFVADSIAEAQRKAESGDLTDARDVLSNRQSALAATPSAQAGDNLCKWLEAEINETQARMQNMSLYQQSGRAFTLSGMSSHVSQRATTRAKTADVSGFGPQSASVTSTAFGGYATPFMQQMVSKSQQLNKTESSSGSITTPMEE